MKRLSVNSLLSIASVVFVSGIASAATGSNAFTPIADILDNLFSTITSILDVVFKYLIGSSSSDGGIFFAKLLIFFTVFAIVYVTLGKMNFFEEAKWAKWLIAILLPVMGVRFITPEFIDAIILSNSVFVVAVTAGLPFVLFFFIVKDWESKFSRRAAWIFFAVVFLAMYGVKFDGLSEGARWIYPGAALFAFLMALFDGTMKKFMVGVKVDKANSEVIGQDIKDVQRRLRLAHEDYVKGGVYATEADYRNEVEQLNNRIKALSKSL